MQNRGTIWLFTTLLAIACLYQLSFSFLTSSFEKEAEQFAQSRVDSVKIANPSFTVDQLDSTRQVFVERYLKDNNGKDIYPILGFTYGECKEKQINLGLDLQGGMSVTLEVSVPEMVEALASNPEDAEFIKAMALAKSKATQSQNDFITEFQLAYNEVAPQGKLAAIFHSRDNATKFPRTATNEEIIATLRSEAQVAIDNTEKILRNRIDKFGVIQPTIQKQQYSGRILVDLPGVKDKTRVRKVLQSTANLEFWETYDNQEVYPLLEQADKVLSETLYPGVRAAVEAKNKNGADSANTKADSAASDTSKLAGKADTAKSNSVDDLLGASDSASKTTKSTGSLDDDKRKASPLFAVLSPSFYQDKGQYKLGEGSLVGYAAVNDTDKVNALLTNPIAKAQFPKDLRLLWSSKATGNNVVTLYAIRANTRDGLAPLDGSTIIDARQDFDLRGNVEVTMQMNAEGAKIWADMTKRNIGKSIAIVLDDYVQSAPTVNGEIPNGRSSISMGSGSKNEQLSDASDLANILKAGALPAPASIVDEAIVGPSLGADNINAGLMSFGLALVVILLYMYFYYNTAGLVADVALLANMFFIVGALASLQASLTLPGIAGIVLTIGMAVDANVLIYERVKEELRNGKALKEALGLGYQKAASAIIDGNLTTLLTAFVLAAFGTGPIKGFATTLIIGIVCSLFASIFISRLIFTSKRFENFMFKFSTKATANLFVNANYNWVGKRKIFYICSTLFILAGIGSIFSRGFSLGVDFTGGRTYTVKFTDNIAPDQARSFLATTFGSAPEVKTIGSGNQLKITTNYLIDDKNADEQVEKALNEGLAKTGLGFSIEESRKVDSTISDDIVQSAIVSVSAALLIIFLYIFIRFRKWQFGMGALASLFHDILLILSFFSLFHGYLPFSMEIDQAFIAALLTILGYSINDTVVVFDRIREYLGSKTSGTSEEIINSALNSTLGRTLNTAFTTFLVMLMVFIFGGDAIKGFVFALMLGVVLGTYSSLCVATPIVIDFGGSNAITKK